MSVWKRLSVVFTVVICGPAAVMTQVAKSDLGSNICSYFWTCPDWLSGGHIPAITPLILWLIFFAALIFLWWPSKFSREGFRRMTAPFIVMLVGALIFSVGYIWLLDRGHVKAVASPESLPTSKIDTTPSAPNDRQGGDASVVGKKGAAVGGRGGDGTGDRGGRPGGQYGVPAQETPSAPNIMGDVKDNSGIVTQGQTGDNSLGGSGENRK